MPPAPFRAPVPLVPLPARLAVLLSGRGSNFEALAEACGRGDVPARIVLVLSDRPDALGLRRAEERGVAVRAAAPRDFPSRAAHEAWVVDAVEASGADLVCLAGYMRLLSPAFIERFPLRIVNIHPSLLPSFPGKDAQAQALAHGVKVSGATVHLVDAGVDSGPILDQEAVPVEPGDDPASLAERILQVEHRLYPRALGVFLRGGWTLDGRRVRPPA